MENLLPSVFHGGEMVWRGHVDKQRTNQPGVCDSGNNDHLDPGHQEFFSGKQGSVSEYLSNTGQ
jgi:hypothetical protein